MMRMMFSWCWRKWLWNDFYQCPNTVVRVTGWNSCLYDTKGGQRVRAEFVLSKAKASWGVFLCVLLLSGCGPKPIPPKVIIQREVQTVEVKVPVMVARVPPAELTTPLHPPRPEFVSPASPEASSALTAEGERLLRGLIEDLLTRIAAWETWATTPEEK